MPTNICNLPQDYVEKPQGYTKIEFYNLRVRDHLLWKQFCLDLTVHNIEHVDIQQTTLNAHHARDLGRAIAKCPFLHTLKLESNNLYNKGIYYIAKGIAENASIKNLYISYNRFDNVGFHYLLKALRHNKSIEYLHLWNNNFVTELGLKEFASFIKTNSNILGICLTSFRMTATVRECIIKALHHNYMLEEFMIWFEDRQKIRSILNTNYKSFQRIASELCNFLLYHYPIQCFPSSISQDIVMEITSFLSQEEKEILLQVDDMVLRIKTMIAQESIDPFEKEMMHQFRDSIQHKSFSKKESRILQKIYSLYQH